MVVIELLTGKDVPKEFVDELLELARKYSEEYTEYGFYGAFRIGKLWIGYYDVKDMLTIEVNDDKKNDG